MVKSREMRKRNGVVYTPSTLANYVAEKVVKYFFETFPLLEEFNYRGNVGNTSILDKIRIIDPACGEGELLLAAWNAFSKHVSGMRRHSKRFPFPDPHSVLCGIDIDQKAIRKTAERIASFSNNSPKESSNNLIKTNALFPFNRRSTISGWFTIEARFQANNGFDIVIANPPWGADTEQYQEILSKSEFTLNKGQFDTSDLFIELALAIVKPGGYFAFIIPDSLFSMERVPLRSMLLDQTEIKYIGRFGEKIFEGINRACVVLICKKSKPTKSTSVDCLRLTPQFRKGILEGKLTFQDAERCLAHKVPQTRFAKNRDYLFDIDVREVERKTLAIFNGCQLTFRDYLLNGRGIELSKSGKVCKCNLCGLWLPYPNARKPKCRHCKSSLDLAKVEVESIISSEQIRGYEPLLVGECVKRYQANPSYWIATDKEGINYKDRFLYESPKILVRKTGVGLLAAMDYQNALTNQVVYIFRIKSLINCPLPLEFFLALMNSRAIYYYLVKSHGETEWRSHPYLTQTQILDLPLPKKDLTSGGGLSIAEEIVKLLKPHLVKGKKLPPKVDAQVEYIVSELYGLSRKDYECVYETLEYVQDLLPIKALKKISISDIFD